MTAAHETWLSPKIRIGNSPIHRKGMFAVADVGKWEKLIVWGDCYTDRAGALEAQKQGKGIMQWDDDVFSYESDEEEVGNEEGREEGNKEQYNINHSCDPGSWMSDAYTMIARRDIRAGEEITADYVLWETNEDFVSEWDCKCGSPLCRGKVTGKDWKNKELQKRYEGHFSPLINKRIEKNRMAGNKCPQIPVIKR